MRITIKEIQLKNLCMKIMGHNNSDASGIQSSGMCCSILEREGYGCLSNNWTSFLLEPGVLGTVVFFAEQYCFLLL